MNFRSRVRALPGAISALRDPVVSQFDQMRHSIFNIVAFRFQVDHMALDTGNVREVGATISGEWTGRVSAIDIG